MGRRARGRDPQAERRLGITTAKRRRPDLELLGRIIVETALADTGPARPSVFDHTQLQPRNRQPGLLAVD